MSVKGVYLLRDFLSKDFPKGEPILKGLLAQQEMHVLVATAKTGKSFFALNLAISVCEGFKFLDKFESNPGKVLVWQTEVSEFRLQQRFKNVLEKVVSNKVLDNLHVTFERIKLNEQSGQYRLEDKLNEIKPKFLILDPLYTLHDGDENSSKDMSSLLTILRDISHKHNVGILLVHHQGKSFEGSGKNTQAGHRSRGSSSIADVPDGTWHLGKTTNSVKLTFELRNEENPGEMELFLKDGWWKSFNYTVFSEGSVEDLVKLVELHQPIPADELKKLFCEKFNYKTRTVEARIQSAVKSERIISTLKDRQAFYSIP